MAAAGKTFLAFGFGVDQLTDLLQKTGDVAAATGNSLQEIALIYGQVGAAGKLTGERLLQLQERGINVGPALADALKVPEAAVKDLVSKGKVSLEIFEKAFASLSAEGGIAFGGLELKSQTLNGKLSTLSDNWDQLAKGIGNVFLPAAKKAVDIITDTIRALNTLFAKQTTQEIAGDLVDEIALRERNLEALKKSNEENKKGGFAYRATSKDIERQTKELNKLNKELDDIAQKELERQKNLGKPSDKDKAAQDLKIANAKETNEKLKQIDQDFEDDKNATDAQRLLSAQERQAAFEQADFEAKVRELDAAGKHEEALTLIENKRIKNQADSAKRSIDLQKKKQSEDLRQQQAFFSTAVTLANSQNKALAAIGKAAALADLAIKTPKAVADSFAFGARVGGPPLGFALGGVAAAAMAAQAAKIAGLQGFEQGGVIGGVNGASAGGDDTIFKGRKGEMVLTAEDQGQLLDTIRGGDVSGETNVMVTVDAGRFTDAFEVEVVQRDRENRTPIMVR